MDLGNPILDDREKEFTYRYGKVHATARLIPDLAKLPNNCPVGDFVGQFLSY